MGAAVSNFLASDFFYKFRRSPVAVGAFLVTAILVLSAVFAPIIATQNPFDPGSLNLMNGFSKPGVVNDFTGDTFFLGADDQGRDIYSTILYGLRVSLFVGFSAVMFAMVLGATLGLIAGYTGGRTDTIIMRIADIQLTFPAILVALLIFGMSCHRFNILIIWISVEKTVNAAMKTMTAMIKCVVPTSKRKTKTDRSDSFFRETVFLHLNSHA